MKLNIPNSGTVDSAFRTLRKRLKNVRKKINAQAAREMKSGDYSSAQKWMEVGSSITDFDTRLEAFGEEWKTLTRAARIANAAASERAQGDTGIKFGSAKKTPVWKFCTPALELLFSTGGSMNHEQVLLGLEESMSSILTNKDRDSKTPRNPPRWHGSVKKAHKHCQREGWIEKRGDGIWKITPKGRAVLEKDSKLVPGDAPGTGDSH